MYNWNDINVELEISQERYAPLLESHQSLRTPDNYRSVVRLYDFINQSRDWLGSQVINLGCQLKTSCAVI